MPGRDLRSWTPALLSLPLVAAACGLVLLFDLAHHLIPALGLLGAAFVVLAGVVPRLEARQGSVGAALLLGAVLLRLPLLALPPTLSDDMLRYLWDGKVAASGHNPYALAPEAEELSPLRDGLWRRLPHRNVPTVYPPLAVSAFSIASRLPFPMLAWKLLVTLADLAACALLLRLARQTGVPEGRAAWYAWNPLVALEVAGMGHVDALGVAAVVAAVSWLLRARATGWKPGAAAAFAAAGVLAKLVPLAAFPLWARRSGRPFWFLAAAGSLVALAGLPVLLATRGVPPGLVTYGVSWEFNGPLYELLWRLFDVTGVAPALARGLDRLKAATGIWEAWNFVYPYLYPRFLARLVLAASALGAVLLSLRERDAVAGTGRLFGRLLLCSATVYPWYLLWVLPWAALRRDAAWLTLSGLILLSYIPQFLGMPLMPWVYLAVWGPFAAFLALQRFRGGGGGEPTPTRDALPPSPSSPASRS